MTYPCVDETQFDPNDGAPTPRPWLQMRHVATASAASVEQLSIPLAGSPPNFVIHTLDMQWTNDAPIPLQVYALIHRGPSQWVASNPVQFTLDQSHGTAFGVAPGPPGLSLVSRFGGGADYGFASPGIPLYTLEEDRDGLRGALIGDTITLPVGQTYRVAMELRFVGIFWETDEPDSNPSEVERRFLSGDTRIDMFSYPLL